MDKRLMKTNNNYYTKINLILVVANFIAATIVLVKPNLINISLIVILMITSIFVSLLIRRYFKIFNRQLDYLISCSEKIAEENHQHLDIIDGEGKIGILSHKLYILNERFFALIEQINCEKIKLKDYIEDISHQIKTPITSMQINEELLMNQELTASQKTKIVNIHEQTLKISNLIDAMLRLTKVVANNVNYNFQEYFLIEIIDNVENVLAPLLIKQDVKINYQGDEIKVNCDFMWMSEAIENIIKNCIEHTPSDTIDIVAKNKNGLIKIMIQDHGDGFSEKDLHHLFERFYTTKNSKGVGIGLALASEIIKGHHGFIEAKNNQGALFIITLPIISTKKKY